MLSDTTTNFLCLLFPTLGFLWAWHNKNKISKIKIFHDTRGESSQLVGMKPEHMNAVFTVSNRIAEGSREFLKQEFKVMIIFMIAASCIIYWLIGMSGGKNSWVNAYYSCVAFIVGAFASCLSGGIGMAIAVYTNSRTAHEACVGSSAHGSREKYVRAFCVAFRGGIVMGFCLTSVGLISLFALISYFKMQLGGDDKIRLYECIAAYGLGGSSIACFGRVGGGIFTKAADVGSDLCGKVVSNLPEDDPRNPGVIADCIGDNVGDIAGMGSDLFGSFGEATCAALVVSAYASPTLTDSWSGMMFPLLITGVGTFVSLLTSMCVTEGWPTPVTSADRIEPVLKLQLVISTVLNTIAMYITAVMALPETFSVAKLIKDPSTGAFQQVEVHSWEAAFCVIMGLWSGLVIGFVTEYYTSNRKPPVGEIARACTMGGAATNVISGLAVGYLSTIIPSFVMAACLYVSFNLCLMYGIALSALGILSTMSIGFVFFIF